MANLSSMDKVRYVAQEHGVPYTKVMQDPGDKHIVLFQQARDKVRSLQESWGKLIGYTNNMVLVDLAYDETDDTETALLWVE